MARGREVAVPVAAAVAVLVLLVWAGITVAGIEPWDNQRPRNALVVCLGVALIALAAAALTLLRRVDAAGDGAERARAEATEHEAEAERQLKRAEERGRKAEQEARRHQAGAASAVGALRRERAWNQELRHQVVALHRRRGALAGTDDVRALVLKVALELTEAKRGVLLARSDADGDGRLDLIAEQGFEEDAGRSALAQRFAERSLERDEVVREDAPRDGDAPADREIDSIIAIPIYIADRLSGVVVCAGREGGFEDLDDEVLLSLGDHAGAVLQNAHLHGRLREAFVATVRLLAETVQAKDPFLRGHSEDVAHYVEAVSERLSLDGDDREGLLFASLLHDVGKLGISERILLKPGRLTPEERSIIELHPRIGFRLVEQVPGMEQIAPAILHHHERWDGAGYPAGLRGEQIPLAARVIGVADAFSAMTEQRPYRSRMSLPDACAELERCAGSQFDPEVVQLFVTEVRERPKEAVRGPVATALDDGELGVRRTAEEGVLGAGTAALTDPLTLLYSHRYFHEAVNAQAAQAALQDRPFSVLVARVLGLAAINGERGYAAGDACLRDCARELSQLAVRHGALACRISGTRLALLVDGLDAPAAAILASELRGRLERHVPVAVGCGTWQAGLGGEDVVGQAAAPAPVG